MEPHLIRFDRILLFRKESQSVRLTNECQLPLSWRFVNLEKIESKISVAKTEGTLEPYGSDVVYFTYHAQIVEECSREIRLLVYEKSWRGEPVKKLNLKFQIESYDVLIDVQFPDSESTYLNFGLMKIDEKKDKTFELKNLGNRDMLYRIDLENQPNSTVGSSEFLRISPVEGDLHKGSKVVRILVTAKCTEEVELSESSIINVQILTKRSSVEPETVATIPIAVSLKSSFSKFLIHPSLDLNFGCLEVGKKKYLDLTIENAGPFQLSYSIEALNAEDHKPKKPKRPESVPSTRAQTVKSCCCSTSRRGSKSITASKKSKNHQESQRNFQALGDTFSYEKPGKGVIKPSASATIKFESYPKSDKLVKETAQLIVTDPLPATRKPTLIDLSVVGCLPCVNFDDVNSIYREVLIVDDLDGFESDRKREMGLPFVVYSRSLDILDFRNVVIGSSHETRLVLTNTGQVTCKLTAQTDTDINEDEVFVVTPAAFTIEPYTSETVTVCFSPTLLKEVQCLMELILEMPKTIDEVKHSVTLRGSGHVPFVEITKPVITATNEKSFTDISVIDLGLTIVGFPLWKSFAFKNTSPVLCKIMMEILGNGQNYFDFKFEDSTRDLIKLLNPKGGLENSSVLSLGPGTEAEFVVWFPATLPSPGVPSECEVRLHTLYNPYEHLRVCFKAEAHAREVFFEGLDFSFSPDLVKKAGRSSSAQTPSSSVRLHDSVTYTLDFGRSTVGVGAMREFTLVNRSSSAVKFLWAKAADILLYPSAGHMQPLSSKVIYAFFFPHNAIHIQEVHVVCTVHKIVHPVEHRAADLGWDSHREFTEWMSRQNRKELRLEHMLSMVKEDAKEPDYSPIRGETPFSLLVLTSGLANYPQLNFPLEDVPFEETLLCQSQETEIALENVGEIPAHFAWRIQPRTWAPPLDGGGDEGEGESATRMLKGTCSMGRLDVDSLYPAWVSWNDSGDSVPAEGQPETSISEGHLNTLSVPANDQIPTSANICSHKLSDKNSLKKSECEMKGNAEAPSIGGYRCPFSITPESGIVEPKNTLICSLVFNPKQPLSFTADLICSVKNTNLPDFVVSISGIGVMSHCHIEIEETDYLKSKRRGIPGPEHPGLISGPILPETRVIEVRTIGVKHSFRKKFNLLNPTEEAYSYEWINVSESKLNHDLSAFSCPNPSGFIQGRRGVEVTFLFLPMKCGTFESLWTLLIPKFSIQQPVLFVGVTREPSVVTDPVQVNLRPTLCGVKTGGYFSLINREEMCLKYRIEECSLSCEEKYNCLDVEPMTGVLKAKSETPFRISYEPKRPGEVCFVVKCKVQKTDEPLSLKVCAKCFEVQPIVSYDLDGKGRRDLHSLSTNYIDLGQLTPRIPKVVNFYVTNVGKAPFYYDCETYPDQCQNGGVAIDCTNKKRELVTAQLRSNIALAVTALEKTQFDDIPFKIRITKGPEYEIKFRGNALVPAFKFSFSEYNFGLCLIQTSDTGYNTTTLCFSNVDESSIFFNLYAPFTNLCRIENVTPENKNFCVDLTTADVPPKTELEITITFCPRNNAECKERLQFLINGLYKHCIDVKGEGFYLSLSLANVADQLIDMGPVLVGKVAKRTVEVVNNSLGAIRLCFIRTDSVRVQPDEGIKVGRKKSTKLVVEYSPRERGQTIFDKVYYKCQDVEEPLLIVKGYGIGPDFTLDKTVLPFGATVVGCLNTLKVALSNRGDIGSRYSWDLGSASKYFTVKPPDGYSSPGSECVFEVSFYPDRIMKMVKNKVTCHLEGSSLDLTLTGTSVDLSSPTEMIDFKCPVRSSDLKAVAIDNATDELWVVHPILSGDYFTGDEVVKILPNTTGEYHIRYTPQTMTGGSAHTGSALFAYPDGTCAVYSLSGVADPPFPVDTLNWEFPCKSNYTATLELANWLQIPQRFSVEIVLLTKVQSHYIPNYNKHVEVLPHFKRDYNIQLYFYKPCKAVFKVSFTNENSKEYMFYLVNVRITECGSLGTLEMSTRVRCTATRDVFITNPTDEETVVAFLSPLPEVEALNTPLIIEPNSVGQLVLQYSPLVESDAKTVEVRCESRVLGSFPYELRLSALPPLPEEALVISAHFGSRTKTTIPVRNLSAFEANFKIKVNPSDISVQDRVIVPPKNVVSVEVTYEPSDMENHTANITVSSLEAGTFVYPVYATCLPPKPQGPYLLKPSAKAKINFRNVFKGKKTFTWAFDNPAFYSSKSSFVLESKKEAKIEVWMVSKEKMGDLRWEDIAVTGKMVVTATDPNRSNISWVYYLRGELT
ncbi:hypothetical protein AAG570_001976 [Ranatra chinensis]|uniref:Uncharacterized protein n=1 Tax=Ranatra chinensis TaxID=642074 RepID=A0ABD0YAB0_9HEMI